MDGIINKLNIFFIQRVYAQRLEDGIGGIVDNPEAIKNEEDLVDRIVGIALPLSIIAAFILLSYGGYLMVSSQGNPEKLQEAKSLITNAIIGLVVILASVGILVLLSDTLGLDVFK